MRTRSHAKIRLLVIWPVRILARRVPAGGGTAPLTLASGPLGRQNGCATQSSPCFKAQLLLLLSCHLIPIGNTTALTCLLACLPACPPAHCACKTQKDTRADTSNRAPLLRQSNLAKWPVAYVYRLLAAAAAAAAAAASLSWGIFVRDCYGSSVVEALELVIL